MEFSNRLKGNFSETLLQTLLEDAGYRIIAIGIEKILREVKPLNVQEYVGLHLPETIRHLPDFFVADRDLTQWWMVEVKYRHRWSVDTRIGLEDEFAKTLRSIPSVHALISIGTPGQQNEENPSAWFRVAPLEQGADGTVCIRYPSRSLEPFRSAEWSSIPRIQDVFSRVGERWPDQTLRKALKAIQGLRG